MKLYEAGTTLILIVAGLALLGLASTKLLKMDDDNVIEEVAEAGIESATGFDFDLSPDSPEKR